MTGGRAGTGLAPPPPNRGDVGTVLLVDDETLIRWALRERLEQDGYRVVEAASGKTALAVLSESEPPIVVLLDMKLPDMSGLDVFNAIRRDWPRAVVILMTAYWASDVLEEVQRAGVRHVLSKPLKLDRVAALVREGFDEAGAGLAKS